MFNSERFVINNKIKEKSEESLNISFSSNITFYQKLNIDTKRDIISLIKSGYDKRTIIKLYALTNPSNINEAVHYLSKENCIFQHIFFNSLKKEDSCEICGENKNKHIKEMNRSMNTSIIKITKNNIDDKINISNIYKKEEENIYIC